MWVLKDDNGWVVVDTGVASADIKSNWRKCFAGDMNEESVNKIIVTHLHPDHIGLAGWMNKKFSAPLYMSRSDYLMCRMLVSDTGREAPEEGKSLYRSAGFTEDELDAYSERFGGFGSAISKLPDSYNRLKDYDYLLFLHDDILIRDFNWANFVITHMKNNPDIDWSSTYGQYCNIKYDETIVNRSEKMKIENSYFFKSFIACFFACRVNQTLHDNCPFVCIPGDNKSRTWRGTDPGDIAAGICLTNILNVWGPDKIGWTSTDGNFSNPNFANSVLGGKRGSSLRISGIPELSKEKLTNFKIDEAIERGFVFKPGQLASHELLNDRSVIVGD